MADEASRANSELSPQSQRRLDFATALKKDAPSPSKIKLHAPPLDGEGSPKVSSVLRL